MGHVTALGSAATPSPVPAPSACRTPDPALTTDIASIYSNRLASHAVQGFIAALGSATPDEQHVVISQASAAVKSPDHTALAAALATICPTPDEALGFSRAVTTISYDWKDRGLDDAKTATALTALVSDAVTALAHDTDVTADQRLVAARPFAVLAAAPPQACASRFVDARTLHVAPLSYPPTAIALRATGTVDVKVELGSTGGVETVVLFHTTLGDVAGSQSLTDATIVAAGSSTYAPEIVDCRGSAGAYIFKAHFTVR